MFLACLVIWKSDRPPSILSSIVIVTLVLDLRYTSKRILTSLFPAKERGVEGEFAKRSGLKCGRICAMINRKVVLTRWKYDTERFFTRILLRAHEICLKN